MERLGTSKTTTHSKVAAPNRTPILISSVPDSPAASRASPTCPSSTTLRCIVPEMRRCSKIDISSPLAAMALLLLLLVSSSFHRAAAARLLQPSVPLTAHHENGAKAAAASASASDGLVLQSGAVVSADELVSSKMSEAEAEEACEEGNDEDCMQRRLLHDAHLDYIYTQRKGNP